MATLVAAGEAAAPGDIVHVKRPFGPWSLVCDTRLSTNKRVCFLEQIIISNDGKAAVNWRLMTTDDDRTMLVALVPNTVDTDHGLKLETRALDASDHSEKTIREFNCKQSCIAVVPFNGVLQYGLLKATAIKFSFQLKGASPSSYVLDGSMRGFQDAVNAAAADPFGKLAQRNTKPEPKKADAQPRKPKAAPEKVAAQVPKPRPAKAPKKQQSVVPSQPGLY
ncbi:invasion associated locus B family protein [Neorhizobium sp. T786]|uniref:invasion associated locus B family protein n=1 Tax=Pseudorhizobium xiangyangii TaxID=2883104 RepID=UPI001CFF8B61|nr:invasion associated locus B family protein [Neorhizobium xiangyangii]MCB5205173.1 invasion associated locus B family protein [Neorhizobium xiangyangii]